MPAKKVREEIPIDIAEKILFLSDRTCCICHVKGKSFQIHHIDENPANNSEENLAVLCLECHTETQRKGGFDRKLTPGLVTMYRNDWHKRISNNRLSELEHTHVSLLTRPPRFELQEARIDVFKSQDENIKEVSARVYLSYYVVVQLGQQLIIPYHQIETLIEIPGLIERQSLTWLHLDSPYPTNNNEWYKKQEQTLMVRAKDIFVSGPCSLYFEGRASGSNQLLPDTEDRHDALLTARFNPVNVDQHLIISARLKHSKQKQLTWLLDQTSLQQTVLQTNVG